MSNENYANDGSIVNAIYISPNKKDDPVNHPSHYTSGNIEVIDFIEDQRLPFHLANAVKYIARAGKKDPKKTVEDLQKAVWYLNRYIQYFESEATRVDCK